jgi:hypothetical protein
MTSIQEHFSHSDYYINEIITVNNRFHQELANDDVYSMDDHLLKTL